ncbi:Cysteine dioxygenase [Phytophthora pseudosyringae]|uniref:Cysteine dioxygenase n=1 Tax=Phytophthora pseudosyringae TaxID=221518 RepID=A0A8T1W5X9_9STRA|nr:Cysteine dioxygenase [Phytophthora pseudosyringae]
MENNTNSRYKPKRIMEATVMATPTTPQTLLAMDPSVGKPEATAPKVAAKMDLAQLVETLERELGQDPELAIKHKPKLQQLLEDFPVDMEEMQRFAHFDSSRNYTRNLISTDNDTYALMLLCWNPGKYSPVHDHPTDGCWVKVVQGVVNEVRYEKVDGKLVETSNVALTSGVTYMDDSFGLHKVGNPHAEMKAISMHLYSPPYEKCRVWFNTEDANKSSVSIANYYTEYGEKVEYS